MLQVTSARHVLRRDADAAEEALRSAEEVGRHSMQELRRMVAFREDEAATPVPNAIEMPPVDQARVTEGSPSSCGREETCHGSHLARRPALYRIVQEALANAARHAPNARTMLGLELENGRVAFVADTTGLLVPRPVSGAGATRIRAGRDAERATALGGRCAAGPTPAGWRSRASFPWKTGAARDPSRCRRRPGDRAGRLDANSLPTDGFDVVAECADGRQADRGASPFVRT